MCVRETDRQTDKERDRNTEKYGHVYVQVCACLQHGREITGN